MRQHVAQELTQDLVQQWRDKHPSLAYPHSELNAPPADADFIAALNCSLRTQVDFLIAEMSGDDYRIAQTAADVVVWFDGGFSTVHELVDACGSHGWNATVYEAWTWQTAAYVRELEFLLDKTSAAALQSHARSQGCYEMDRGAMYDAIDEARRALEGEP